MIKELAKAILEDFDKIQGMMNRLAGASFLSVLHEQKRLGIKGDLVEFGVYKGKSAFILANCTVPDETLALVDIKILPEVADIKKLLPDVQIHEKSSIKFFNSRKLSKTFENKVRFLHVDGSHTFDNVTEDLEIAEALVSENGLVVLDDFLNPHYPQVQAATYRHLYVGNSRFSVFLIGDNKAFLCNKNHHGRWLTYSTKAFADDLEAIGYPVMLSRTDSNTLFDATFFRGRKPDDHYIYGPQLYSRYFPNT